MSWELFALYFDKNFIENVIEQIKRYALQREKEINVTVDVWLFFDVVVVNSWIL